MGRAYGRLAGTLVVALSALVLGAMPAQAATPTAEQMSTARQAFVDRSAELRFVAVGTKNDSSVYNVAGATRGSALTDRAFDRATAAMERYRSMTREAGRWSAVSQWTIDQQARNRYLHGVAQGAFRTMTQEVADAQHASHSGFSGAGKPLTFADETALDVLKAIGHSRGEFPVSWSRSYWLYWRIAHESSGNRFAQNGSSSAYGRFQFLDSTWRTVPGGYKTSDGMLQSLFGMRYIRARYGNPDAAPHSGTY